MAVEVVLAALALVISKPLHLAHQEALVARTLGLVVQAGLVVLLVHLALAAIQAPMAISLTALVVVAVVRLVNTYVVQPT